jgi:Fic family protein
LGRNLPNPELLIRPFSRIEAVASSKIEGTVTPGHELLKLELSPETSHVRVDTREVHNYNRALSFGLQRLAALPLSRRLFSEIHAVLLEGVSLERGARFTPGEFKKEPNWIGAHTIQNARFVPPPPIEAMEALADLEKFIHRKDDPIPLLIKLALIHYQFEAIHPFPDGNGRMGRLIIPLMLCEQKAISQPLLYLSAYLEKHYQRYIDLMFDVSKSGAWENWIEFFLAGIEAASNNAILKAKGLQDLHRNYLDRTRTARSSALLAKVVDSLFAVPATTIPHVVKELGISYNAAKSHLQKLVEHNIIVPDIREERPQWFYALEIIQLVNAPDS